MTPTPTIDTAQDQLVAAVRRLLATQPGTAAEAKARAVVEALLPPKPQ